MKTSIELNPEYERLRPFVERIPSIFGREGTTIYHLRNEIKVMTAPDGTPVNVKRYHRPRGLNEWIYSMGLRKAKVERAYQYAGILARKGIRTPVAMAMIEERSGLGLLGFSYLVSEQLDWGHTLYEFGNAVEGEYEEMALALARYAAHMHEQQVLHKDFTPGNVLWRKAPSGYDFAVVDINRMYFGKVGERQGLLNLKKFWGPKRFVELLVREYSRIRGFDEDRAVDLVLSARARFWKRYQRKHQVPFKLDF